MATAIPAGGGDGGRWVLIILFALFGRGGDRGFGGGYGTGDGTFNGGIPNGFALATGFASLERKMDGVGNGLCDGLYAAANGMDTGFAAVRNALCQGLSGVDQAARNRYPTDTPRPCPSPAYITCDPWAGRPHGSCTGYGRGCN